MEAPSDFTCPELQETVARATREGALEANGRKIVGKKRVRGSVAS